MRVSQILQKYTPLIKFGGSSLKHAKGPATAHPLAPNGIRPTKLSAFFNDKSIEPKEGEYFSRAQLPLRFRYKVPKEDEAENIISGGAEYVF